MMKPSVTLTVASLILLIIFWGILLYLSSQSVFPQTQGVFGFGQSSSLLAGSSNPYLQPCPTGQCATNIYNGEKRCPVAPDTTILSNLTLEVCNPRESCTAPLTPFAVNSDGSTNIQGICELGIECRCVNTASCANYITTFFETVDGNPYVSTNGQRTRFRQHIIEDQGQFGSVFNPLTTFCRIPTEWLPRSAPGCTFDAAVTPQTITACMDGTSGNGDPCLVGTLAFVTQSQTFNPTLINRIPVACVEGQRCPIGQVAVYDLDYERIICTSII